MSYIAIAIYFLRFCCQALGTIPAPVNVTVDSLNFEHNLRWDPGPGTPNGTTYNVLYSPCGNENNRLLRVPDSSAAVVKETLQNCTQEVFHLYAIKVRAVHLGKKSRWRKKEFTPFTDTVLGPPEVNVSGCGDCLNVTITLPKGKAEDTISEIYHVFKYHIFYKIAGERKVWNTSTTKDSLLLRNLEPGVKYCVQVKVRINVNKHILPSGWVCDFTSPRRRSPVLPILACVSVLLILGGLVLYFLIHVGVLYKLKTPLPKVLSLVQSHSCYHYFVAEDTTPDAITYDADGRKKGGVAVAQQMRDGSDEEDDDEEEEDNEGDNGYENHMARLLDGSSSDTASRDTTGSFSTATTALSTAENSGNSGVAREEAQWAEPPGGRGIPDLSEVGREQQETHGEAEDGDTDPGENVNVNLLSVMLAAPEWQGGTEQMGELWGWQEPLLSTGSADRPARLGGALADRQADSPELIHADRLMTIPDYGQTDTHDLQTHTNWKEVEEEEEEEDEEEDEDEEECSGYMRH